MRFLYLSLILVNTYVSFTAQTNNFTIETLEKLSKLNMTDFEDWALNQNLNFETVDEYESFDVVIYSKENDISIQKSFTKDGSSAGSVEIQTRSKEMYLNMKKKCLDKGYKFDKSEMYNDGSGKVLFNDYLSQDFQLSFYISNKIEYYGYNIRIRKLL